MQLFFVLALALNVYGQADSIAGQQNISPGSQVQPAAAGNGQNQVLATMAPSQVLAVRVLKADASSTTMVKKKNIAYADDILEISISNPTQFLSLRPSDQSNLILYADGIQLKGIVSSRFKQLSKQDVLSGQIALPDTMWIPFELNRDSTSQAAWRTLYRIADNWYSNSITFQADLGWEGMFPLSYKNRNADATVTVVFYTNLVYWTWLIFYIFLIGLFIFLCAKTNLIREGGPGNNGAFSLAQTQLVFWTVLIIGGFIYSVVLTDLTSSLNPSILLMLGVSIGTTGIATSINYYKKQKGAVATKVHQNFLYDILSDGQSLSVHRAQILMWNIVFGIYLVYYTISHKTMPEFSETMLVLSGISSSFYLGSKVVENGMANGAADALANDTTISTTMSFNQSQATTPDFAQGLSNEGAMPGGNMMNPSSVGSADSASAEPLLPINTNSVTDNNTGGASSTPS